MSKYSTEQKWEIAAKIVDDLQDLVDHEGMTAVKLINSLAENFPRNFPAENCTLSIVYKTHITPIHYKLALEKGQIASDTHLEKSSLRQGEETIKSVIYEGISVIENDKNSCSKKGFDGYGSLMIVPMRPDPKVKEVVIGTFIILAEQENLFENIDLQILDKVSDRLAIFIRHIDGSLRSKITEYFFTKLISKIGMFEQESDIFSEVVSHLSDFHLSEQWFAQDEINIILFHPLRKDKFYLVCHNGNVNKNFRDDGEVDRSGLQDILGDMPESLIDKTELILCNTEKDIEEQKLPSRRYKSYILVPMRVRLENSIGFIILRDANTTYSYKAEQDFLRTIADYTASMLRNFRRDKSSEELHWFRKNYIRNHTVTSYQYLYDGCVKAIASIYGKIDLVVVELNPESHSIAISYPAKNPFISLNYIEDKLSSDISSWIKNKSSDPVQIIGKEIFVFFTSTESGRIANLFIIKANRKLGNSIINYIEELVSLISFKQSLIRKRDRIKALIEFGKAITAKANLSKEDVFNLAYQHTSKVMSVANMYIALLDKKGEISFPLFRQRNEKEVIVDIKVSPRLFDKSSNEKGRTEVILEDKEHKHILIHTKEQSLAWYAEPGHKNKIDDPFAAWAGVPIINKGEAIGVIAIYHSTAENLYTESNIDFLETIATHISDLLSRLDLEDALANNTELKEAQADILEKEALLTTSLIAQDITHRLNNSLSSLSINISQSTDDTRKAISIGKIDHLNETICALTDAGDVVDNLIKEVATVSDIKPQVISIIEIAKNIADQIKVEKKLDNIRFYYDYPREDIKVNVPYRNLVSCLHSVIENAATALQERATGPFKVYTELYLRIIAKKESNRAMIDIIDNGSPIPEEIIAKIFDRGVTTRPTPGHGYGLWRARILASTIGGQLDLVETQDDTKIFRVSLPVFKDISITQKQLAFVIDDERAWRKIITRWLQEENFEVKTADSRESAQMLFANAEHAPKLVFLDISLNRQESSNVEGLGLISLARKLGSDVKIVLLTGYAGKAGYYKEDINLLINKIVENRALTKDVFFAELKKHKVI